MYISAIAAAINASVVDRLVASVTVAVVFSHAAQLCTEIAVESCCPTDRPQTRKMLQVDLNA